MHSAKRKHKDPNVGPADFLGGPAARFGAIDSPPIRRNIRQSRAWALGLAVAGVMCAGGVALVSGAAFDGSAGAAGGSNGRSTNTPTAGANERDASAEAERMLSRLVLPTGAVGLQHEPTGDAGTLSSWAIRLGTPDLVDLHAWWRVPASARSVMAFIRAHPPGGSQPSGSGSGNAVRAPYVQFAWPALPERLQIRWLIVAVAPLRGGATGVRADAEVQWTVPRAPSERIPAGVREIDLTRPGSAHAGAVSITITKPVQVRDIVAMVDRLPTVQPGTLSCSLLPNRPVVTFEFRASRSGPALAQTRYPTPANGTCGEAMRLTIHGQAQTPLLNGGTILTTVDRLLGTRLAGPV
jgi:hypothetical protein